MTNGFEIYTHILREELVDFIDKLATTQGIYVFAQKFNPFRAKIVEKNQYEEIKSQQSEISRLMLTIYEPLYPVNTQFPENYPDSLHIPLPAVENNTLPQIFFGFRVRKGDTYDEDALLAWKAFQVSFKKLTKTGVYVTSRNGSDRLEKSYRYSAGAFDAYQRGIKWTIYDEKCTVRPAM